MVGGSREQSSLDAVMQENKDFALNQNALSGKESQWQTIGKTDSQGDVVGFKGIEK